MPVETRSDYRAGVTSKDHHSASKNVLTPYDVMDGMRALAAITVLLGHLRSILFLEFTYGIPIFWKIFYFITGFGHQAVMIFFVLSGYWITKSVVRSSEGRFSWPNYAIDRISRLWIVLIPALLIGGLLDSLGRYGTESALYLGRQGNNTVVWDVGTHLTLVDLAGNIAFLQTLIVPPFGSNGALWSLANEFWYYVWFPPIYKFFRRDKPSFAAIFFVILTMAVFNGLLVGFICWLCGTLLFFLARREAITIELRRRPNVALAGALSLFCGALLLSRIPHLLPMRTELVDVLISGSFALTLLVLISSGRTFPGWISPLCRYGARSSYSLYLVHFPFIMLLAAVFITPSHRLPPSSDLLLAFLAIGATAILYGYAFSSVTEVNTSRLRGWLRAKLLKARYSV